MLSDECLASMVCLMFVLAVVGAITLASGCDPKIAQSCSDDFHPIIAIVTDHLLYTRMCFPCTKYDPLKDVCYTRSNHTCHDVFVQFEYKPDNKLCFKQIESGGLDLSIAVSKAESLFALGSTHYMILSKWDEKRCYEASLGLMIPYDIGVALLSLCALIALWWLALIIYSGGKCTRASTDNEEVIDTTTVNPLSLRGRQMDLERNISSEYSFPRDTGSRSIFGRKYGNYTAIRNEDHIATEEEGRETELVHMDIEQQQQQQQQIKQEP